VLVPGFGSSAGLLLALGRVAVPGATAPGWSSFRFGGMVRAGQAGTGKVQSRCQQAVKASFHGQSVPIFRVRSRAWTARRAGMCRMRQFSP
jgi:hypothetical protein